MPKTQISNEQRFKNAIGAIKAMGVPTKNIKRILDNLLLLFDENWDAIEADNYSVFVDALLTNDEEHNYIQNSWDPVDNSIIDEDLEQKVCSIVGEHNQHTNVAGCSTSHTLSRKRKQQSQDNLDEVVSQENLKGKEIVIATNSTLQNEINPLSSRKSNGQKMLESNANQNSFCFKRSKSKPVTSPGHINIAKKRLVGNHSKQSLTNLESQVLQTTNFNAVNKDTRNSFHNDGTSGFLEDSSKNIEIASSVSGQVKLSFSLNGLGSEMCFSNLESVFRKLEEKFLRSCIFIQPNFSIRNILTEMCETVQDLSKSSSYEKLVNITPRLDCSKKNYRLHASVTDPPISSSGNPLIKVTIPHHEPALGGIRPLHDVNDVAKGEERVRISILNEVSSERYPPSFSYIPQNIVYQHGHVDFSLARIGDEDCCSDCFGDCLSASIPCPCARHTGGKYAYTPEGLLTQEFLNDLLSDLPISYCNVCPIEKFKNEVRPEPCKGHFVLKFIKECWVKCGCSKQCGNRVVQRGITCNLQIFYTSENKGWGVRTLDELPRGTFVCEYIGEILTNDELYERNQRPKNGINEKHTYPVMLDADWASECGLKDEEALCLDATFYGNIARFINHRCSNSNLINIPVEMETPDHHYYHVAFFTSRKVDAFEELTWDYGIDFTDHMHPVKAFRCLCGSDSCRDNNNKKSRSNKISRKMKK